MSLNSVKKNVIHREGRRSVHWIRWQKRKFTEFSDEFFTGGYSAHIWLWPSNLKLYNLSIWVLYKTWKISTDSYKRLFRPISIERKIPKMIKIKRNIEVCYLHQVRCSDEAVPLLVEHSKSLPDLVLNVGIFELPGHNVHSFFHGGGVLIFTL